MSIQTHEQPRTSLPMLPANAGKADIDYELFLDCVHCGLCTSACPTYVENGDENDSPRGRIYLMRAVTDGRLELTDQVQGASRPVPRLPGVRIGLPVRRAIRQADRAVPHAHERDRRQHGEAELAATVAALRLHAYAGRMRLALAPARFLQWTGARLAACRRSGLLRLLPKSLRQMHEMLPPLKPHYGRLPEVLPAEGPRRARVALFTGCAADAMFPETTQHTAWVLQKNGCEVWIPRNQVCCGALHYHAGRAEPAQAFGQENCRAFFPDTASRERQRLEPMPEVDADHRQRRRLRGHAQGLWPSAAAHAHGAARANGSPTRSRTSANSCANWARSSRRTRCRLRRSITMPAICAMPSRFANSRGSSWR